MSKKPNLKSAAKKVSSVKQKLKRRHEKIQPVPPFPPYIRGIKNPLVGRSHVKRPLVIALARLIKNDKELEEAVRLCGCLYLIGNDAYKLYEPPIKRNEWSGKGYAYRTGRAFQDSYQHQHKIDEVMPFAKALYDSMKAGTIETDRTDGLKEWEENKKGLEQLMKPKEKEE